MISNGPPRANNVPDGFAHVPASVVFCGIKQATTQLLRTIWQQAYSGLRKQPAPAAPPPRRLGASAGDCAPYLRARNSLLRTIESPKSNRRPPSPRSLAGRTRPMGRFAQGHSRITLVPISPIFPPSSFPLLSSTPKKHHEYSTIPSSTQVAPRRLSIDFFHHLYNRRLRSIRSCFGGSNRCRERRYLGWQQRRDGGDPRNGNRFEGKCSG